MGRNEGGVGATPTSISIFDSYVMKTLWFKFGHAKTSWDARFLAVLCINEIVDLSVYIAGIFKPVKNEDVMNKFKTQGLYKNQILKW